MDMSSAKQTVEPNCNLCMGETQHEEGCPNAKVEPTKEIIVKCGYCGREETNIVPLSELDDFLFSKSDGLCDRCEEAQQSGDWAKWRNERKEAA